MQVKYGPYSPSRLEVANCPFRFKAEYKDKIIKDERSLAARRGNVVHETFEEITKAWLINKGLNWDQVVETLTKLMALHQLTEEDAQNDCIGAARCYMFNPPKNLDTILGTEEQIAVKHDGEKWVTCNWDDPDAYARGKIDLLLIDDDNEATIIDHKTQLYVQSADTFQMGFYAWLVKIAYPYVTGVNTILHFCHPDLDFYSKPSLWDKDDIENMETRIKVSIGIVESVTEHPAIPNHYCVYCPLKMECPKLEEISERKPALKGAKKGPLLSAKAAQKHAEVITVLEENNKDMKKSLRTFVEQVGPVQLPGLEYGMVPSDGYEVPLENRRKLIELLGDYGQDPYSMMSFPAARLKKLWKVLDQKQLESVRDLLRPTKKTSFKVRKV